MRPRNKCGAHVFPALVAGSHEELYDGLKYKSQDIRTP
jgi:hypothetical protein